MKIENRPIEEYRSYLKDKHRPPSRGGNTSAWHQHVLKIDGEKYAFLALGARKWAFKNETVSFDWKWSENGAYRDIIRETLIARDKNGKPVLRGNAGSKRWRSATTRLPASRREQRD